MWAQTLSWATTKQQCASKFSSNAGKVQRLPWQAGKNIGKMNCEHSDCSSLSCSKRPGLFEPGLVEQRGERIVGHAGGDEVGRIICWQLKRQQGSWTSLFFKKCFPPEGQGAMGQSLSCKGMALTNQPPSVFSNAAAWHAKQQLIESLVHFGFTSAAAFLLFVLFVFLRSTHCFSYVLIQSNTHLEICEVTLIFQWLLFLNSHSNKLYTFPAWTFISVIVLTLNPKRQQQDIFCTIATKQHWNWSSWGMFCTNFRVSVSIFQPVLSFGTQQKIYIGP